MTGLSVVPSGFRFHYLQSTNDIFLAVKVLNTMNRNTKYNEKQLVVIMGINLFSRYQSKECICMYGNCTSGYKLRGLYYISDISPILITSMSNSPLAFYAGFKSFSKFPIYDPSGGIYFISGLGLNFPEI